jgi:hypothetical protein
MLKMHDILRVVGQISLLRGSSSLSTVHIHMCLRACRLEWLKQRKEKGAASKGLILKKETKKKKKQKTKNLL